MHAPNIYKGHNTKDATHWEWLQKKHGKPIYMQEVDPLIPDSVRYPLDEAKALCGVDMFPTTFAYMAALAVMHGYEQVRVYGVELSSSEYAYQANGYLFWFGFLLGRLGVNNVDTAVKYLDNSIFSTVYYGYEGGFSFGQEYFADRKAALMSELAASEKNLTNITKAIMEAIERNEFEKVKNLVPVYQSANTLCGQHKGALQEAERYHTFGSRDADRGGFENQAAASQQRVEPLRVAMLVESGKVEYVWNVWQQSGGKHGADQLKHFIKETGRHAFNMGGDLGMFNENVLYLNKYDETQAANGVIAHA